MSLMQNSLRTSQSIDAKVLNIAHRGARAFAPENTLPAFEKAKSFDCEMFELDVHMSKDGRIVVHHDDDLLRCTDVKAKFPGRETYYISDFTYSEIMTLDAGSWYINQLELPPADRRAFLQTLSQSEISDFVNSEDLKDYASGSVKVPLLEEALELATLNDMMVNIEIKTIPRMYRGLTEAIVDLVKRHNFEAKVLISSFDHEQLTEVRNLSDSIPTGVLTSDRISKVGDYLSLLDADAYNPGCYAGFHSIGFGSVDGEIDVRGIMDARAIGKRVNVWTCNDKHHMKQLIRAGVTRIISDFPNRTRQVRQESW